MSQIIYGYEFYSTKAIKIILIINNDGEKMNTYHSVSEYFC